jgi:hypothetical protein
MRGCVIYSKQDAPATAPHALRAIIVVVSGVTATKSPHSTIERQNIMIHPNALHVYYLAGPMAGYPNHNHPEFHAAAAKLRACGHIIVSPAEYGNLSNLGWQQVMKRDIHALLWTDAIIALPGWDKSRGATLETNLARTLDMPVFDLNVMLCDCITIPAGPVGLPGVWHTESCIDHRVPIPGERIQNAYNEIWNAPKPVRPLEDWLEPAANSREVRP